jgi:hypothetical protein
MLIELYATASRAGAEDDVFCFITSNFKDFAAGDDHRKAHPDLAEYFDETGRSRYYHGLEGLALALRDHFGEEFDELLEDSDFEELPRTLAEIHEAEQEFYDRIWYDRDHEDGTRRCRASEGPSSGPASYGKRLRVGHVERQALGSPLGARKRVGFPRHLVSRVVSLFTVCGAG